MRTFDVAVIGGGPGGYVAAIRCAQLGMQVALIEKYSSLGGTCLNVGCIPSKALLDSSEHYYKALHEFEAHGIQTGKMKLDFGRMISRKNEVVTQTCSGIDFLMKKNKIERIQGKASFAGKNELLITQSEGSENITAKNIIVATGSKPSVPGFLTLDKKRIISSTEALSLNEVPKKLLIIGGGIIGLELGSVYMRLGSEVHVIEFLDRIAPSMDVEVSQELKRVLGKQGMKFYLSHQVKSASVKGKLVSVMAEDSKGTAVEFSGDYCLVAVGRRAYTEGLALEKAGLQTDERGRIATDSHCETPVKGIYAIGDVTQGPMLAHKAEEEGTMVAEIIAGQKPHIRYDLIPGVCYTWPEAAAVGADEKSLKEKGIAYKSGKFTFRALGRARASMDIDGFVKVLADAETDEILGVHMIGARCADLIIEAVVAMEYRASAEDISRMSHPHPTYTEAFKEACLAATANRAIHM